MYNLSRQVIFSLNEKSQADCLAIVEKVYYKEIRNKYQISSKPAVDSSELNTPKVT